MKSFVLHGNARSVEVTVPDEDYIRVRAYNSLAETQLSYFLAHCDYKKLASFSSISALLKFAKENHVFRDYPKILCPCPPETSDIALSSDDDLDGGILSITKRLKEIKEEINLINGTAFEKNSLTDAQHYQLLDVEMFIGDFIAPYAYREVIK